VEPLEHLEDPFVVGRVDADATVLDREGVVAITPMSVDLDTGRLWAMILDGVRQDVLENL
jgi:hypothetical protein